MSRSDPSNSCRPSSPDVEEPIEAVVRVGAARVVEVARPRVVGRGVVALRAQIGDERPSHERRQRGVRVVAGVAEQSRIEADDRLELGDPAAAADGVHIQAAQRLRVALTTEQRAGRRPGQREGPVRIERGLREHHDDVGEPARWSDPVHHPRGGVVHGLGGRRRRSGLGVERSGVQPLQAVRIQEKRKRARRAASRRRAPTPPTGRRSHWHGAPMHPAAPPRTPRDRPPRGPRCRGFAAGRARPAAGARHEARTDRSTPPRRPPPAEDR